MPTTLTTDAALRPGLGSGGSKQGPGGGDPLGSGSKGAKDWPPGFTRDDAIEPQKYRIGMWVGLASILMLFVALTSAYIVRGVPALSGGDSDWLPLAMPRTLWVNTAVLLLRSVGVDLARRALNKDEYVRF